MRTAKVLPALAAAALLAPPALAQTPPTPAETSAAASPATPPKNAKPATVTDAREQVIRGEAYYYGRDVPQDYKQARQWYEKAAAQKYPPALRLLGQMQAAGLGGKKDRKAAIKNWQAAEKAGDRESLILVADAYYEDITGQKDPKPGRFGFRGGVPQSQIDDTIAWYQAALERDPRPEVRKRSQDALYVLQTLKAASVQVKTN